MQIDLHGYTKHDAWKRFKSHVEICDLNGLRKFVVITGYGAIYEELPRWCEAISCISSVKTMLPNRGSYQIILKKKKKDLKISITSKNSVKSMVNIAPLLKKWGSKG
jgi:DNA-nicking Smr family endonuclease